MAKLESNVRETLKGYFSAGKKPTAEQFVQLIDAFLCLIEDGVRVEGDTVAVDKTLVASKNLLAKGAIGVNTPNPVGTLDIAGGADANGSNDPAALALQYRNGGYRHFIRSRHMSVVNHPDNAIEFFVNSSATPEGSSKPGTGNSLVMTLRKSDQEGRGNVEVNGVLSAPGIVVTNLIATGPIQAIAGIHSVGPVTVTGPLQATSGIVSAAVVTASAGINSPGPINAGAAIAAAGNLTVGGSVGVGTTTPGEKLEVAGSVYVSGASYLRFDHKFGDANDGKIGNSMFAQGLNIVGINNDQTYRKISLWGQISQHQNDGINTWGGTNFFAGRVGIGTNTPMAPLHVTGGQYIGSFFLGGCCWPEYTGDQNFDNWNPATANWGGTIHSIVSDWRIRASALDVTNINNRSDIRTKRVVGKTSGASDLRTLMQIEITDYTFIDTITDGWAPQKKVIAQQIEKVFPQAASRATGVIPDLFQRADIRDGWISLATDLRVGERVRLIGQSESGIFEVLEVQPERFRTEFKPEGDKVFVYGREVKDLASVDYDAIAMLNVSATQELARQVERQAAEIEVRDQRISALEQRLSEFEARDRAREDRLLALESSLSRLTPLTPTSQRWAGVSDANELVVAS